jgi:glycosyltransferase involved in cell wall biosynthesis
MMPSPIISVVLPVHNGGEYLAQALDSILTQSFEDFELIIIDDGSADNSATIIETKTAGDRRCRRISREKRGFVDTCNQGFDLARGEYVFRMDADDVARPNRFELQLQYLLSNPDCVAVGSRVLLVDPAGLPLMEYIDSFTHDEIYNDGLNAISSIVHPSVAIRRSSFVAVGGYRNEFNLAEDLDLFLRLAEVGTLANLPTVLLEYRQHLKSVGYQQGLRQAMVAKAAASDARRRRGIADIAPSASTEPARPRVIADEHRKWAWWAIQGGNIGVAREHAWKGFWLDPISIDNVRLLACVVRGR